MFITIINIIQTAARLELKPTQTIFKTQCSLYTKHSAAFTQNTVQPLHKTQCSLYTKDSAAFTQNTVQPV